MHQLLTFIYLVKDYRLLRKIDCLMACTACLVCLVSTVSGHCKNALGSGSASSGHIIKLEQSSLFFRYLCKRPIQIRCLWLKNKQTSFVFHFKFQFSVFNQERSK